MYHSKAKLERVGMPISYSKQQCEGYAQWLHQILVAGWPFPTLLLCGGIQLRKLILSFMRPIHSQLNWEILLCDVIPNGKNWVNCPVLTGNSAGLRTVLSSSLSHRELRSSLRKSHSFLSLPANTTMASSQGTFISSSSFSRWTLHDKLLFKYHILLKILSFLFFFSGNIMADVASKQQTTALFLSTIVTRTRRYT